MPKIMIVNTEAGAVKIEVRKRDEAGRYRSVSEHKLRGFSSKAVVIEHGQSVQIIDPSEAQ